MEYELDEIRRDIKLISFSKFKVLIHKNSLVSNPMDITTKKRHYSCNFLSFLQKLDEIR